MSNYITSCNRVVITHPCPNRQAFLVNPSQQRGLRSTHRLLGFFVKVWAAGITTITENHIDTVRQNGYHCADHIFKPYIFHIYIFCIFISMSLNFFPNGEINKKPLLEVIMTQVVEARSASVGFVQFMFSSVNSLHWHHGDSNHRKPNFFFFLTKG